MITASVGASAEPGSPGFCSGMAAFTFPVSEGGGTAGFTTGGACAAGAACGTFGLELVLCVWASAIPVAKAKQPSNRIVMRYLSNQ
ncbi:MAG: hypothetical protein ABSF92_12025 [Candidatus Acidiferrales bacterium]